jgi:DNA-binding transcriptional regulator YhcF (GntR family)
MAQMLSMKAFGYDPAPYIEMQSRSGERMSKAMADFSQNIARDVTNIVTSTKESKEKEEATKTDLTRKAKTLDEAGKNLYNQALLTEPGKKARNDGVATTDVKSLFADVELPDDIKGLEDYVYSRNQDVSRIAAGLKRLGYTDEDINNIAVGGPNHGFTSKTQTQGKITQAATDAMTKPMGVYTPTGQQTSSGAPITRIDEKMPETSGEQQQSFGQKLATQFSPGYTPGPDVDPQGQQPQPTTEDVKQNAIAGQVGKALPTYPQQIQKESLEERKQYHEESLKLKTAQTHVDQDNSELAMFKAGIQDKKLALDGYNKARQFAENTQQYVQVAQKAYSQLDKDILKAMEDYAVLKQKLENSWSMEPEKSAQIQSDLSKMNEKIKEMNKSKEEADQSIKTLMEHQVKMSEIADEFQNSAHKKGVAPAVEKPKAPAPQSRIVSGVTYFKDKAKYGDDKWHKQQ